MNVARLTMYIAGIASSAVLVISAYGDTPNPRAVLAAGTPVPLELAQTIKSNGTGQGDPVEFHVVSDVYSTDTTHTLFIAKGSIAMGHVIVANRRSHFGKPGALTFTVDYALATNGGRVYLHPGVHGGTGRSNKVLSIASAVVVGDIGFMIQGHDKKFVAGTPVDAAVDQDASMTLPLPPSTTSTTTNSSAVAGSN